MRANIEAERARNGMTKEQLADEMGISVKTYYNWLNEETDIPGSKLLNVNRCDTCKYFNHYTWRCTNSESRYSWEWIHPMEVCGKWEKR